MLHLLQVAQANHLRGVTAPAPLPHPGFLSRVRDGISAWLPGFLLLFFGVLSYVAIKTSRAMPRSSTPNAASGWRTL